MKFVTTLMKDVFVINSHYFADERGTLVKPFEYNEYSSKGLQCNYEETFYSVSKKGVLRGFHFQLPPKTSEKLVWVSHGIILDAVLDLRTRSETYNRIFSIELSAKNHKAVYLPKGMAHAFCVLSNEATVHYQVSNGYSPDNETGIKWNSVNFNWPVENPIVSERDNDLPDLKSFKSPF